MREIKFRLIKNNRVIGYEKWYGGNKDRKTGFWTAEPCWLYSENGERWNPDLIVHSAKDQYTGLKDKNGKEIYEGDVLSDSKNYESIQVEWSNTEGGFLASGYKLKGLILGGEVIGNIYETPELLEKKT